MQKLSKKFKYLIFILAAFALLIVLFYFLYLKKVAVCEPVNISIQGISPREATYIEIKSTSPLGRVFSLKYNAVENFWWLGYGHHKELTLVIPDSLTEKIKSINIAIGDSKKNIPFAELGKKKLSNEKITCLLSQGLTEKPSIFKIISSVFFWDITKTLLKILLILIIILLLFFLRKKIKTLLLTIVSYIKKTIKYLEQFAQKANPKWKQMSQKSEKKLSIYQVLLWVKIIVISVVIALGLYFGYLLLRYCVSSYFTCVMFIVLTCMLLWVVVFILSKKFKKIARHKKACKLAIILFLIIWFSIENYLRIKGVNDTMNEVGGIYYSSGFIEPNPAAGLNPHLILYDKYLHYINKTKDFSYEIRSNAEGVRDIDHPIEKEKGEYRIICIGNSFTEGIGAPQDSTWPILLANRMKPMVKNKLRIMNSGKGSFDPFFEYVFLRDDMLKYKPDLVMVAIGYSDLQFYPFRGGFERFTSEGFKYREGPRWEKLYAVSYIFRYYINNILNYKYFMSPGEFDNDRQKALNDVYNCMHKFDSLARENHFRFAVVFYDDQKDAYELVKSKLIDEKKIMVFDLFAYNKDIEKLNSHEMEKFFWQYDPHYRPIGYDLVARGVLWNLEKTGIIDSINMK